MSKVISVVLLIVFTFAVSLPAQNEWLTEYEKSNFVKTDRYDQTVAFCKRLTEYSNLARYESFGLSPQGRELPLLILDKDREFNPEGNKTRSKAVILIQAGIHSGEIEGKDAGLTLFRDMLVHGKFADLLDSCIVLFIPIFSVDAHERFGAYNRINQNGPEEMGWRTTAQNLNLNRDFMKADAPEMRAWLKLFNKWLPDVLTDIHTTDGADFQYVIMYAVETHSGVAEPLRSWTADRFLPELKRRMKSSGYDLFPYFGTRLGHDVTSGLESGAFPPRLSNGYGAAQNRPFVLIETHMLKSYKQRVESVYAFLINLIGYCNENATEVKSTVRTSDSLTAYKLTGSFLPVDFDLTKDSTMIDFAGVEFHFEQSSISGAKKIIWDEKPATFRVPMFGQSVASDSALVPFAYLIPQEWAEVISRLQSHGISTRRLAAKERLEVVSFTLTKPKWALTPYEGRHGVEYQIAQHIDTLDFPAGTIVVFMNQRSNRVISQLLEPNSKDSFVRWGFFNAIFEQKEYAEDYVLEELALKMLAESALLRSEFESKLRSDATFAASPSKRLNFFYEHSEYWDKRIGEYPIRKLLNSVVLKVE